MFILKFHSLAMTVKSCTSCFNAFLFFPAALSTTGGISTHASSYFAFRPAAALQPSSTSTTDQQETTCGSGFTFGERPLRRATNRQPPWCEYSNSHDLPALQRSNLFFACDFWNHIQRPCLTIVCALSHIGHCSIAIPRVSLASLAIYRFGEICKRCSYWNFIP